MGTGTAGRLKINERTPFQYVGAGMSKGFSLEGKFARCGKPNNDGLTVDHWYEIGLTHMAAILTGDESNRIPAAIREEGGRRVFGPMDSLDLTDIRDEKPDQKDKFIDLVKLRKVEQRNKKALFKIDKQIAKLKGRGVTVCLYLRMDVEGRASWRRVDISPLGTMVERSV